MKESQKGEYFVDGFFLKHFKMFPAGVDPETFFPEQKAFVCYLIGNIPELQSWSHHVSYLKKKNDIETMTTKDVILTKTDIELSQMRGIDLEEKKREVLESEIKNALIELNKEYGVQEEVRKPILNDLNNITPQETKSTKDLWEKLNLKGIVNNG